MDIIITAFTNVTGNPTPNSTWTRDGNVLTSGMMYGTDNTGVLMISNVMSEDSGNYTNTLQNMFNNKTFTTNFTISLQILSEYNNNSIDKNIHNDTIIQDLQLCHEVLVLRISLPPPSPLCGRTQLILEYLP